MLREVDPAALTFALGYALYCAAAVSYLGWTLGKGVVHRICNRKKETDAR